jgi:1,4-dihydroxy-2-naphthoate polyprenyltransferase
MKHAHSLTSGLASWFSLSRPPFHTVGVLPFILGAFLAWKTSGVFNIPIFLLGTAAVILIMLSTYQAGEYFDEKEDRISKKIFNSRFSGGSGIMPRDLLPKSVPLITSIISFLIAGIIGLVLQFYFKTGSYTMLLGCLGAFPGFFYSTKPIRIVERGIGELFIGFCYGWLPVAVAFYLQTGYIHPLINWISIPIGLTIFNVILLNEFPDYLADSSSGKKNILVRFGKTFGVRLYAAASIAAWAAMIASFWVGVPLKGLFIYLPVLAVSIFILIMMKRRKYENPETLEMLCGLNIVVNLGTTASCILSFL